jgi:pyruvate/2-oxoglutarate dehydrogenase complex dihydrolipoamide acyltransferase (E2) component
LTTVAGTGEGGRITREDILEVVRQANQAGAAAPAVESSSDGFVVPGAPATDKWGPVGIEKPTNIRKTIAKKMHESWSTVPRVTNFDDADVTELEAIRQTSKADYKAAGIKLTSMPFLIKAVSMALRQNPAINSNIDLDNDQIIYKQYVNVGIAVDTDNGLMVPVLRNTDQKSISELARDLAKTATNVRDGNFSLDDLRGGTFTISNLGAIGGTYSTPIVNVPEVAILLVGRSRKMPVVVDDEIEARLMMPLSLSYDHRIIDGATAARFLNDVIGFLEAPGRLLLAP